MSSKNILLSFVAKFPDQFLMYVKNIFNILITSFFFIIYIIQNEFKNEIPATF